MTDELYKRLDVLIQRVYLEKDFDYFRNLIKQDDFILSEKIKAFINNQNINACKIDHEKDYPSTQWIFDFPRLSIQNNLTLTQTTFVVSKLYKVFTYKLKL